MSNESRGRFDSKTTHYLRPDRPYVCGRSGSPCSNGPTVVGTCPHRDDRCEPRINEGHLRKKVHRWVILLFLGGVMVTLASADEDGKPFQQKLIDPGPLSHVHARFDCRDCHSEEINSWSALLASAWHGGKDTVGSEGCLECHQQGEHAKYAHGVSPKELRSRSSFNDVEPFEDQTECTVCHSEHGHGNSQQILSDSRCQACHQQDYDSFRSGHPEFSDSYGNRDRVISFSHSDHFLRHFKNDSSFSPNTCSACHELEPATGSMSVKPFEVSCGQCHSEDIYKSEPFQFFAFPSIFGMELLEEEGMGAGSWPEYIDAVELTPWTRRWYQNSEMPEEFAGLMESAEIEAEPGNPVRAKQLQNFAMEVKRAFIVDMANDLADWIRKLLPQKSRDLNKQELAKLSGQFPIALLLQMQQQWFPELDVELNRFTKGLAINVMPEDELAGSSVEEDQIEKKDNSSEDSPVEEGDLLAEEDDLLTEEDDLLAEEDDLLLNDEDVIDEELVISSEAEVKDEYSLQEIATGKKWASLGGWYEQDGVIWFKTVQHADPFLMAWIHAELTHGGEDDESSKILSILLDEKGPGRCTKCHTGVSKDSTQAHWGIKDDPLEEKYTHFSHAAHVFNDDDFLCTSCHTPRETPSPKGHDWFPVRMDACTNCHGVEVADGCTLCHQYHASPQIRQLKASKLNIFGSKEE